MNYRELRDFIREDYYWFLWSEHYEPTGGWFDQKLPRIYSWFVPIRWAWGWLRQGAAIYMCWLYEHEWVDNSSIGPDSATESHYCSRCGKSWSFTYY